MKNVVLVSSVFLLFMGCKKSHDESLCLTTEKASCEIPDDGTNGTDIVLFADIDFNPSDANQFVYVKSMTNIPLYEIRKADLKSCKDIRLLSDSNPITGLDWSVNGKISFTKDLSVYMMNDDGSAIKDANLTPFPIIPDGLHIYHGTWSPNGQKILAAAYINGEYHTTIRDIVYNHLEDKYPSPVLPAHYMWYDESYIGFYFDGDKHIKRLNLQTMQTEAVGTFTQAPKHYDYNKSTHTFIYVPNLIDEWKAIYSLNPQTGQSQQVSAVCPNRSYEKVKLSPDGKKILSVCRYMDTNGTIRQTLSLMNVDGSGEAFILIPD